MKILQNIANIITALGLIGLLLTIYSLTVESYSKRNSAIYLQARIISEQSMDLLFQDLTNRSTIDLLEIYKLEALLMEKPILTSKFFDTYNQKEEKYKESLKKLKDTIQKYNAYRVQMMKEKMDPNLDNEKSLCYKNQMIAICSDIMNTSGNILNSDNGKKTNDQTNPNGRSLRSICGRTSTL